MNIFNVVSIQLKNIFCVRDCQIDKILQNKINFAAESKTVYALSRFNNKYYSEELYPFNSVIYCNYLYWLSKILFENSETELADKVYYLNKVLNSVDLFYEICLPEIWSCEHPLGSVMGRAKYGNHFFFYQGCTVGGNINKGVLEYPVIGEYVTMYSNSKIIGSSRIGNNVLISANTYVKNEIIPDNSIVFGQSPNIIIKERKDK